LPTFRLPGPGFNRPRLLAGLFALVVGVVFYFLERPPGQTYFLPDGLVPPDTAGHVPGMVGQSVPTFLHPFAFSLLTASLLRVRWTGALVICAGWALVESLFEIGQYPPVAEWIAHHRPSGFEAVPLLENVDDYFLRGRFDIADLAAIWLGAGLALPVIHLTRRYDPPDDG